MLGEVELGTAGTEAGKIGLEEQVRDTTNRWRMISLNVHSRLIAVGFIAAVSARLRDRGMCLCLFLCLCSLWRRGVK